MPSLIVFELKSNPTIKALQLLMTDVDSLLQSKGFNRLTDPSMVSKNFQQHVPIIYYSHNKIIPAIITDALRNIKVMKSYKDTIKKSYYDSNLITT
jgi:hypothetical protein